ncbi:OmpH family outer membrane protein [Nioella sp. MMSF_3534]|uniref:OmpH family outer membrane protein n=1 Tax=Nioella sp. MMSF_3534 TaxID=3046720 RepID=UPI00273E0EBC|nr:OmpH family outer membrane protein [Nioella sp. MMSF_3534]
MRLILISLAILALSGPVFAQPLSIGRIDGPPIVILNQERLFSDSLFGQRVQEELAEASSALSRQNRELETALLEEEQSLTEQRTTMSAEEFRPLAEDFDRRAEEIRAVQAERLRRLRAQADGAEQLFFELITPILSGLLNDIGAAAVLDSRVVIYVAEGGDVTDMALQRVNAELGDGGEEPILDQVNASAP